MTTPWAPFEKPLAVNIAITGTDPIRLDFPPGRYAVSFPHVQVTVNGGPTEVTITASPELAEGAEVYTHIKLQFPAALVGLRAFVWVVEV